MNLEELIEAYNQKTIDAAEFYAAEYQLRRSGSGFGIDYLDTIPSHPLVYRRLKFNLTRTATRTVLQKEVDRESLNPKSYHTVEELVAFMDRADGWRDMDALTKSIKEHVELENKQRYSTEPGESFHDDLLRTFGILEAKWLKRLDDVPAHPSNEDKLECNPQLSAILDSIAWSAYILSGEAVETVGWVGKAEPVKIGEMK
jgi:hypothetical protein